MNIMEAQGIPSIQGPEGQLALPRNCYWGQHQRAPTAVERASCHLLSKLGEPQSQEARVNVNEPAVTRNKDIYR